MSFSDEDLSAYLDGAAPAALRAAIDDARTHDDVLERRLNALSRVDEAVRAAYGPIALEPVPTRVAMTLQPRRPESLITRLGSWMTELSAGSGAPITRRVTAFAMTAIAAFLAGVTAISVKPSTPSTSMLDGYIRADHPLHGVFERQPSGARVVLGGVNETEATPLLTFQSVSGEYCREIQTQTSAGSMLIVGCRGERAWRIVVAEQTEVSASSETLFATASGDAGAAVAQVLDSLVEGDALSRTDEELLISRGWQAPTQDISNSSAAPDR